MCRAKISPSDYLDLSAVRRHPNEVKRGVRSRDRSRQARRKGKRRKGCVMREKDKKTGRTRAPVSPCQKARRPSGDGYGDAGDVWGGEDVPAMRVHS